MNLSSAIDRMYATSLRAPRTTPRVLTDVALDEAVDRCLAGKWSAEDLIETRVDELSTAASVGSGPARALRMSDEDEKETLEKLLAQFEGYRRKMGLTEVRTRDIHQFLDAMSLPERLAETFVAYLKFKNVG